MSFVKNVNLSSTQLSFPFSLCLPLASFVKPCLCSLTLWVSQGTVPIGHGRQPLLNREILKCVRAGGNMALRRARICSGHLLWQCEHKFLKPSCADDVELPLAWCWARQGLQQPRLKPHTIHEQKLFCQFYWFWIQIRGEGLGVCSRCHLIEILMLWL